jgi:hypothetical protein
MKTSHWIPALLLSSTFAVSATYAFAQMGPPGPGMHHKHKAECPMMKDGKRVDATATVEDSPSGAIIRVAAKNTADVAQVRELARMVAGHIENGCPMHPHDKK